MVVLTGGLAMGQLAGIRAGLLGLRVDPLWLCFVLQPVQRLFPKLWLSLFLVKITKIRVFPLDSLIEFIQTAESPGLAVFLCFCLQSF